MRRLISLLLLTCSVVAIHAFTFTSGKFTYTSLNATDVKMSPTDRSSVTTVTLPGFTYYNGTTYNVTEIDFSNCTNLRTVSIWSGPMTKISNYAFSNCTSLTNVTIEEGITEIGASAFEGCTSLTSLTIPESVTTIERYIIRNTAIKNIFVPKSAEISPYAFVNEKLESIDVEEGHPALFSTDGVLYWKGRTYPYETLMIYYPDAKKDAEFTLNCSTIAPGLNENKYIQRINITATYPKVWPAYFIGRYSVEWYEDEDVTDLVIRGQNISHISIGAKVHLQPLRRTSLPNLQTVEVDPNSIYYTTENGLIYTTEYNNGFPADFRGLWLATPSAQITSYTGAILNNFAFEWSDNLTEIFDFSPTIGFFTTMFGNKSISVKYLKQPVTYYAYPSNTAYMPDYMFYEGENDPSYQKPRVMILADIATCTSGMDDNGDWISSKIYGNFSEIRGPKGGNIRSLLNSSIASRYTGDLNIIKVDATEDIQNKVSINNHRTHVLGVNEDEIVAVKFSYLPSEYRVLINGNEYTGSMNDNTIYLTATSHATIQIVDIQRLTVEANDAISTTYIDGIKNNSVIADGNTHTVHIVPHEGYYINQATLNNADITDKFVNRTYTVPASTKAQNLTVDIQPENEAKLTVQNPEFRIAHYFNQGARVMVDLTPHEGWEINSATFNDEDITDQINSDKHVQTPPLTGNDILTVTYNKNVPTNIENIQTEGDIHVYTRANAIVIKGKEPSQKVVLYNESGLKLLQTSESVIENLPGGVYILTIDSDRVFKLAL